MKHLYLLLAIVLGAVPSLSAQTLRWSFETGDHVFSSPAVDGETVYFGSGDGNVYAVDAETGLERWRYETQGAVHSSPAIDSGILYINSRDGALYALSAEDGQKMWSYQLKGEQTYGPWDYYLSSPVVVDSIVFFGSGDHSVYALDKTSGSLIWSFATEGIVHASPTVTDGIVYVGSYDGVFYALDAKDGSIVWKFDTIGDQYFPKGEIQKAALVENGTVYFGSRDYNIYALDAATGTGKWNMKERGSWVIATPLLYNRHIYFGTSDSHHFYAMDAQSGEVAWTLDLNMRAYGSAVHVDEKILFGCFNGKLYAVNPETGDIHWTYQTEGSRVNYDQVYNDEDGFSDAFISMSPDYERMEAAILSLGSILSTPAVLEGTVYFGSADGRLYAVAVD